MNPRPLGYEQAGRCPGLSRPVAFACAGLSGCHGGVSFRLAMSGTLRGVLVTTMVTGQKASKASLDGVRLWP